jgi:methylmalonyl-CoA carboxyltransferase large subunit
MTKSGVIHFIANDDRHAMQLCHKLLSFLPSNNLEDPPQVEGDRNVDADPALDDVVPVDVKKGYDVRDVILRLVDFGDFWRCSPGYAMPTSWSASRGSPGAAWASSPTSPMVMAGCWTSTPPTRRRDFIRFCNAFNIPLLTLVDVPGFMPGTCSRSTAASSATARRCCSLTRRRRCRKITVILRKCYGGAYLAMCGKDLGADRVFAWPTAEVAVMGAEGAAEIVFRKEIQEATDKKAKRAELIERYREASRTRTSRPDGGWWTQ